MGGKGRRRREKNYLAAHGGDNRLPPPPTLKELEALPSKLRKIMMFKNPSSTKQGSLQNSEDSRNERRKGGAAGENAKKANPKDVHSSAGVNLRRGENFQKTTSDEHKNDKDATTNSSINTGSKQKRKRKEVNDFRFQELDQAASHLRKKKRKEHWYGCHDARTAVLVLHCFILACRGDTVPALPGILKLKRSSTGKQRQMMFQISPGMKISNLVKSLGLHLGCHFQRH